MEVTPIRMAIIRAMTRYAFIAVTGTKLSYSSEVVQRMRSLKKDDLGCSPGGQASEMEKTSTHP